MSKKKLVLSHAAKDKPLVDAVVEMLEGGTTLDSSELYCTAMDKRVGVPGGEKLVTYLDEQLQAPKVAILLLTPNYFSNRFCLCEMGALLARAKHVLPLLVPPLKLKHIPGMFVDSQLQRIDDVDDLNKFASELHNAYEAIELDLPRWAVHKKKFLTSLPALIQVISAKD